MRGIEEIDWGLVYSPSLVWSLKLLRNSTILGRPRLAEESSTNYLPIDSGIRRLWLACVELGSLIKLRQPAWTSLETAVFSFRMDRSI